MQSVYGLTDPDDELVHYVGRAQDVYRRYAQHLISPHPNAEKNEWMASVKARGKVPGLLIFEQELEDELAPEREMWWIAHYLEQGAPLTNMKIFDPQPRQVRREQVTILELFPQEDHITVIQDVVTEEKPVGIPLNLKEAQGRLGVHEWLTVEEIADELKLHTDTVREWIRTKQLPAYKFGTHYRVKKEDYERFVSERSTLKEKEKKQQEDV